MAEEIQAQGQTQMTTDEIDARITKAKALLSDVIDLLFPVLGEENTVRAVSDAIEERLDYHIDERELGLAQHYSDMVH